MGYKNTKKKTQKAKGQGCQSIFWYSLGRVPLDWEKWLCWNKIGNFNKLKEYKCRLVMRVFLLETIFVTNIVPCGFFFFF
jgi:hypothetical protein